MPWREVPIVGVSYADDTRPYSYQECINYIPVMAEVEGTRAPRMHRSVPGMVLYSTVGTGPIRGMHNCEGQLFVVSGPTLYQVTNAGTATNLGTIPGSAMVSMAHNQIAGGNQVAIATGTAGYVYNTVTGTLAQITSTSFPGARIFDYVDSYIAGVEPNGKFWFISALADATTYSTLAQMQAEASPDDIVTLIVNHREVWVMGERTIEPFYDTGAGQGTFQRANGIVIERGCAGRFTSVVLDNAVFWLGNDGSIYRSSGYTPIRISTRAIEQAISRCDWTKAIAFAFEDRGHKIYYLTFPDGPTFGYDVSSGLWHRRKSYGFNRWRINALVNWGGGWIGGDSATGKLYQLDWGTFHDDTDALVSEMYLGTLQASQNRMMVHGVELVMDTGRGEYANNALAGKPGPPLSKIASPSLTISGSPPVGRVGSAYSFTWTATGGTGTGYVWSLNGGAIPPGLTLHSTGIIDGTPTSTLGSPFNFTLKVVDSAGNNTASTEAIAIVSGAIAYVANDGLTGGAHTFSRINDDFSVTSFSAPGANTYPVLTSDKSRVYFNCSGMSSFDTATMTYSHVAGSSHTGTGRSVITPDGAYVFSADYYNNCVYKYRTSDGALVLTINTSLPPSDLAISPDGLHLYIPLYNYTSIYKYTIATDTLLGISLTYSGVTFTQQRGIAISPDGTKLVVCCDARTPATDFFGAIVFVDVVSQTTSGYVVPAHPSFIPTFSPDGTIVAVCDYNNPSANVFWYRASDMTLLHTSSNGNSINGLCFSADGTMLYATSGGDDTVLIYDTASYALINTVSCPTTPYGVTLQ